MQGRENIRNWKKLDDLGRRERTVQGGGIMIGAT
jgi:hypothetical protein